MNAKFIKFVLISSATWVVLVLGLLMNVKYLDNIALAYLWVIAIGGIILGIMSCSDSLMDIAKSQKESWEATKLHRTVSIISKVSVCVLVAATGHFVLLSFLIIGLMLVEVYRAKLKEK